MTVPKYQREQEAKWLKAAQTAAGNNRHIAEVGYLLAVLLQGENLYADQKHVIQVAIDELEMAIPYSILP